ncbi:MAG: glycosyltransferase family 39 protein [Bdellovibrionaceae bacterium]|nr:glycosyltransferase family 39 protein [Bdellovibrio sp.]
MNHKKIFSILTVSFFIKVGLALFVPLFADEAYYYVWTQHPQLSYFDHPPMVSWFIFLGEKLFPFTNGLSTRFIFIIGSIISMYVWARILKLKAFSDSAIFWFLILMQLNPLLGPGAIMATPDLPLVLFWSLSYLFFLEAFNKRTYLAYALLGVSLGLGFCSKYHIVLFVISGLIYLIVSKKLRQVRPLGALLTILFGLIFCLPVVWWNYQNEWSSFAYQINHGFVKNYYDWTWTPSFILSQVLILNPFLLTALFKKSDRADKIFTLTQFLFFLSSSFKAVVEANWPITAHLHGAAVAATNLTEKRKNWALGYWAVIYILFIGILFTPLGENILKNQISSKDIEFLEPLVDQYQPLYGPSYQISSLLTWSTGKTVNKLRGLSRHDFYDSLTVSIPTENEFYVLKHKNSIWPEAYVNFKITKIKDLEELNLELFRMTHE